MILPFLHEKRVYLNRQKTNTYYFYSSIDTPYSEIEAYNKKIKASLEDRLSKESKTFEDAKIKSYIKSRQDLPVDTSMTAKDVDSCMSIVCINLNESKYYMYGTDGILQFRYDYTQEQEMYGKPIKSSSNGQSFIFKKSLQEIAKLEYLTDDQLIERFMTINIMKLTIFSFKHVK